MNLFDLVFGPAQSLQRSKNLPSPGTEGTEERDFSGEAALEVAKRFGRGNVAMQFGRILTAERLEAEREEFRRSLHR